MYFSNWWKEFFNNPQNHDMLWGIDLSILPCPSCATVGGLAIELSEEDKKEVEKNYENGLGKTICSTHSEITKEAYSKKDIFLTEAKTQLYYLRLKNISIGKSFNADSAFRRCRACRSKFFTEEMLKLAFMRCVQCGGKLKFSFPPFNPRLTFPVSPIGCECEKCKTLYGRLWENFNFSDIVHKNYFAPRRLGGRRKIHVSQ